MCCSTTNDDPGLSTVRKAIDTRDGSSVAVKFIVAPSDELTRKVFDRETRALRSLGHPNIVRFRDADVDETGTYYIVLDWVERNLVDLLEAPIWEGWGDLYDSIAAPLLDGLAHAHLRQLEHRDIKPGNILIEATGAPKLADFGIAKIRGEQLHSELTVQNFRSGPYAPPGSTLRFHMFEMSTAWVWCSSSVSATTRSVISPMSAVLSRQ